MKTNQATYATQAGTELAALASRSAEASRQHDTE